MGLEETIMSMAGLNQPALTPQPRQRSDLAQMITQAFQLAQQGEQQQWSRTNVDPNVGAQIASAEKIAGMKTTGKSDEFTNGDVMDQANKMLVPVLAGILGKDPTMDTATALRQAIDFVVPEARRMMNMASSVPAPSRPGTAPNPSEPGSAENINAMYGGGGLAPGYGTGQQVRNLFAFTPQEEAATQQSIANIAADPSRVNPFAGFWRGLRGR